MELYETIEGMISKDYKERFIAEYRQLIIRLERLDTIIEDYNYYVIKYLDISSLKILKAQRYAMDLYKKALEVRAEYEGINLD